MEPGQSEEGLSTRYGPLPSEVGRGPGVEGSLKVSLYSRRSLGRKTGRSDGEDRKRKWWGQEEEVVGTGRGSGEI